MFPANDTPSRETLQARYAQMDDAELLARYQPERLTALATAVLHEEITARGLTLDAEKDEGAAQAPPEEPAAQPGGDFITLRSNLGYANAHALQGRLQAEGIHAVLGDVNLATSYSLIANAVGGIKLRVQASDLAAAQGILAEFEQGTFAQLIEPGDSVSSDAPRAPLEQRLLAAFAGDDAYPRRWLRYGQGSGWGRYFNFFALVVGPVWLMYRKCFGLGAALLLVEALPIIALKQGVVDLGLPLAETPGAMSTAYLLGLIAVVRVPLALSTDALYLRRARRTIATLQARHTDEATLLASVKKAGGISVAGVLIAFVLQCLLRELSRM